MTASLPGTRLFPDGVLDTREAYLVIRARLARLARKARLVGDSSVRVAPVVHVSPVSRTTYERCTEEGGLFEQPMGSAGAVRDLLQPCISQGPT
jgi:hypothetical protein